MPLNEDEIQSRLRGVSAGLLTPFDDDSRVEHGKIRSNARSLHQQGIDSFLSVANISEYHSLSRSERVDIAETSVSALPSDACVLAGVGGGTDDAIELMEAYEEVGVDAMMIMPPHHTYLHERGLLEYYSALGEAADRPLVPYVKGFEPSVEYLADLADIDEIVGIKYALTDTAKLGAAVEAGPNDVVWVNGLAEPLAPATWVEGAEGFSAGVSNFRPEVGLELFDALSREDWSRARRLRNVCLPYQQLRGEKGTRNDIPAAVSIPVVKKGLELAGLHGGGVREPLQPLSPAEEERAETLYRELDEEIGDLIDTQATA
ncbi:MULTISPECIES: dihydrodipicolinate synthase family protein [Haloferacaceae]|uniref:Dihydrodipicolinate synthase family protein n=1 Tax=Halorubrum glutamatedens TaxID=2707018 RepID=A0ABD5QR37_9EURY|nr:dihydrodipicolinate synthase family protein [Halobellus captivus]